MIGEITVGTGARGCLDYLFDADGKNSKIVEFLGGTAIGISPEDLAPQYGFTANIRPGLTKYLVHISLSAAPKDGEIDRFRWIEIAESLLKKIGFDIDDTIYTIFRHRETNNDHIHIAASKIMLDGSAWDDGRSKLRVKNACREIEKEFKLTPVASSKPEKKPHNKNEPGRENIQNCIDAILKDGIINTPDFIESLKDKGITVLANIASTGKLNGFSFRIKKFSYKGSELGTNYTFNSLIKRGLNYNPKIHAQALIEYNIKNKKPGDTNDPPEKTKPDNPKKGILQDILKITLREKPSSIIDYVTLLKAAGVIVTASQGVNGRLSGFRYALDGVSYKGSELGYDFTVVGLNKIGITYDRDVDFNPLKKALELPPAEIKTLRRFYEDTWPDNISPPKTVTSRKISSIEFRAFLDENNLFWKKIGESNHRIFYNKSEGKNYQGIAFVDRRDSLDVEIGTDNNILMALKFGFQKWGSVVINGSPDFCLRAEALAKEQGIPYVTSAPSKPVVSADAKATRAETEARAEQARAEQAKAEQVMVADTVKAIMQAETTDQALAILIDWSTQQDRPMQSSYDIERAWKQRLEKEVARIEAADAKAKAEADAKAKAEADAKAKAEADAKAKAEADAKAKAEADAKAKAEADAKAKAEADAKAKAEADAKAKAEADAKAKAEADAKAKAEADAKAKAEADAKAKAEADAKAKAEADAAQAKAEAIAETRAEQAKPKLEPIKYKLPEPTQANLRNTPTPDLLLLQRKWATNYLANPPQMNQTNYVAMIQSIINERNAAAYDDTMTSLRRTPTDSLLDLQAQWRDHYKTNLRHPFEMDHVAMIQIVIDERMTTAAVQASEQKSKPEPEPKRKPKDDRRWRM